MWPKCCPGPNRHQCDDDQGSPGASLIEALPGRIGDTRWDILFRCWLGHAIFLLTQSGCLRW
jgi:hypothetical protein